MDKEIVVKVENLVKSFGDRTILKGVNLEIYRGETFVIMGGSGCGKSTLLRHMIGAMKPDEPQRFGRWLGFLEGGGHV